MANDDLSASFCLLWKSSLKNYISGINILEDT